MPRWLGRFLGPRMPALAAVFMLLVAFAPGAAIGQAPKPAERNIALVIGNAKYAQVPLDNPENDARAIAANLRKLGYEVEEHLNLGVREFRRRLRDFARRMQDEEGAAVFYYAGHGMQIDGRNYLLPVDVNLRDQEEVKDESIDIDDLLVSRLERARSRARIIILDACRDNPFGTTKTRGINTAAGLAEMSARGALIAFASAPGAPAEDGPPGTHSIYTKHLSREMMVEGVEVEQMFKNVRVNVLRDTNQRQVPWVNTSLTVDFSFNPGRGGSRLANAGGERVAALEAEISQLRQRLSDVSNRRADVEKIRQDLQSTTVALAEARSNSGSTASPTPVVATTGNRKIAITLEAGPQLNTDQRNASAPVVLRLYQLRAPAAFETADFLSLFERDQTTLGRDLLVREELFLRPGQTVTLSRDLDPQARSIGVFAAFRQYQTSSWRAVGALGGGGADAATSAPITVRVRAGAREVSVGGGS